MNVDSLKSILFTREQMLKSDKQHAVKMDSQLRQCKYIFINYYYLLMMKTNQTTMHSAKYEACKKDV